MTLVLATCAGDAVVFGADSKIQVVDGVTRLPVPGPTTGRKLFKFARVGIATYGEGPPEHVPTVISALDSECSVDSAIDFMRSHFRHAPQMGALIGGLDERGSAVLFDFPMAKPDPEQIWPTTAHPSLLVFRGFAVGQMTFSPVTTSGAIDQMLQLLHPNAVGTMNQILQNTGRTLDEYNQSVGPPYELLVIERGAENHGALPR
jgi:hypothetical protein